MKRRGRKFWTWVIGEMERSGESLESVASRHAVRTVTLRVWRNRLRREAAVAAPRMVAVRVAAPPLALPAQTEGSTAELQAVLPDGLRLRFGSGAKSAYVVAVLQGLRAGPC